MYQALNFFGIVGWCALQKDELKNATSGGSGFKAPGSAGKRVSNQLLIIIKLLKFMKRIKPAFIVFVLSVCFVSICQTASAQQSSQVYIHKANNNQYSPGIVYAYNAGNFTYDGEKINSYGFGLHDFGAAKLNAYASGYFGFDVFTGNSHRFRVTQFGKVGIGVNNPEGMLDVLAPEEGAYETLLRLRLKDTQGDYFKVSNGTSLVNQFIPSITGYHETDNRQALHISASTNATNDNGDTPLMIFDARRDNGTITNRPLFAWDSYGETYRKMTLMSNGHLGVGIKAPTSRLHVVSAGADAGIIGGIVAKFTQNTANSNGNHPVVLVEHTSAQGTNSSGLEINMPSGGDQYTFNNTAALKITTASNHRAFIINDASANRLFEIDKTGRVGVGVTNFGTDNTFKLFVKGGIRTEKAKIDVASQSSWGDYVFEPTYRLAPLNEIETYIKAHKHLPGVPSAATLVKKGLDLGKMHKIQMVKIEELTLHTIAQEKKIKQKEARIDQLEKKMILMMKRLEALEKKNK